MPPPWLAAEFPVIVLSVIVGEDSSLHWTPLPLPSRASFAVIVLWVIVGED